MNRILAIDPGTHCGWALRDGETLTSGTWELRQSNDDRRGRLYLRMHEGLISLGGPVNAVYYEKVQRHMGTDAAHMYGGYMAILQAWCESWEPDPIPYFGIAVGTIKKHATGNGRATKEAMVEAAQYKWPEQEVEDDNQADALWILDFGTTRKGKRIIMEN